jgi:putative heme iron utilization protein
VCGCNGGNAQVQTPEPEFVVRLPNGTIKTVTGEHAAKVEVTMAGGGSYQRK